jgi:tetratricopeptide (TPR) repeat protein
MNNLNHGHTSRCGSELTFALPFWRCAILFSMSLLIGFVVKAQTAQPSPTPTSKPAQRRALPKLSSGARGFDVGKGTKDASARLIAVGGGWGAEEGKKPRLKGQTAKAYFDLGSDYLRRLHFSKAIPPLEKAVKLNSNYLQAYDALGKAYAYYGSEAQEGSRIGQLRYRQAIRAFEQARRLAPGRADLHLNLGVLYFNAGQYQKAVDSFQEGVRLTNGGEVSVPILEHADLEDIYVFIAEAYENMAQSENAINFYQRAIDVKPNEEAGLSGADKSQIYRAMGHLYQRLGEVDKALAAYQKSIVREELWVQDAEVFSEIGAIYVTKQNYAEAAIAFSRAVEIYEKEWKDDKKYTPDVTVDSELIRQWEEKTNDLRVSLATAYYNLGVAQLSLNQAERAIESFKRAVDLDEKNADARFNMGFAYLKLGNKDAALDQARFMRGIDSKLAKELEELIYK